MDNRRLKREGKKKQSYSLEDRHWIPSTLDIFFLEPHWRIITQMRFGPMSRCQAGGQLVSWPYGTSWSLPYGDLLGRYSTATHPPRIRKLNRAMGIHHHLMWKASMNHPKFSLSWITGDQWKKVPLPGWMKDTSIRVAAGTLTWKKRGNICR